MTKTDLPAKCGHCSKPMTTPVFCDFCETLALPGVDHFALLGLPRRFEIDEQALHAAYMALSRHSHPDFHADGPPEVQSLAMAVSSAVNEAYRTLADPMRRAGYLLELQGGPSSAADKSVPDGFLETMIMMQEELHDAKFEGTPADLGRLRGVLQTQHDGLVRRVAALFGELEQAAGCEAARQDLLHQIRQQLNAAAYVRKMMGQL